MAFIVYILRTSRNTLYIGQTNNLERRLEEHAAKRGRGAKYTRCFEAFELVYTETFDSRSTAMHREYELKQWTKQKKEALIANQTT